MKKIIINNTLPLRNWVEATTDPANKYWYFESSQQDFNVYDDFPIKFLLLFACTMFFISILGIIFNRKNILSLILCVELMLFSLSLNFIFLSIFLESPAGQIFALIIVCIAAADSAIGLGILIAAFHVKRNISFETFSSLKG